MKKKLSWCPRCDENSTTTELYGPKKTDGIVLFSRATFCLNKGCGFRIQDVPNQISISRCSDDSVYGIVAYLRRRQKAYPNLRVRSLWIVWTHTDSSEDFETYFTEMEKRRTA